ncbi:MAG: crossover junction endodeoxyribonuclease RuvC [Deltaproteobacteria bacterium]|nr:crossover junction endodeoxyribonuclease RuvC [Deltaproteobacteria bacterium]
MSLVLGLDPGSRHTGYGLIRTGGAGKAALVTCGRLSPPPAWPLPRRLFHLHEGLTKIMAGCPPAAVAVESLFTGRNIRSAVVLAQARGVLLLAAAQAGAEIFEYTPREIKNAVTGYGQAGKDQVGFMVAELLDYREPLSPDAADALAAALCHAGQAGRESALLRPRRGRGGGWRDMSEEDLAALGQARSRL